MPFRYQLQLPGRVARGSYVGQAACRTVEHRCRDLLARQVAGYVEVSLTPYGRADVATPTDVYEVEPFASWPTGLRQVAAYALGSGCRPNLALFGRARPQDWLRVYLLMRDGPVRLWRLDAAAWSLVTSRAHCTASRGEAPR